MKKIILITLIITFPFLILAQKGQIKGFIYDDYNGEPIPYANVFLDNNQGSLTDINGYFIINDINPGEYKIKASFVGYVTKELEVKVNIEEIKKIDFSLKKENIKIQAVNVSVEKENRKNNVKIGVTKITPKQISKIPSVGGEADIAQYLQIVPGVVSTGDQGGQIYIRGGTPIQNKVLLDGITIYNPFHSIGLFSVFDTDILKNLDVYTGGFGSEFGGRISSIMNINTRDGNKKRLSGKFSTNTFGGKILLEGPISKNKSSFIISGKSSFLDKTSKTLYTYIDTGGLPYTYTDLYSKISFMSKNGSKVSFFGFNFNDQVNYRDVSNLGWNSLGAGSNFVFVPNNYPMLISGQFAFSSYDMIFEELNIEPRYSSISGFNLGLNFKYFQGRNELKYGIEVLGFKTDYEFINASNLKLTQNENSTELSLYGSYKIKYNRLIIEPGIRIYQYNNEKTSLEPRLGSKYNISENLRIKLATGHYTQSLVSAVSDRDVVNLFYGFLSNPQDIPETFQGEQIITGMQQANHLVGGIEIDLTRNFDINIEAYLKDFKQLTNINKDKLVETDNNFIIEKGVAQGIDLSLKYKSKKLDISGVYSYGFITREDENIEYHPHFDRRHNINFVSNLNLKNNLRIDCRWNLGSGFPFTQTQGFYQIVNFEQINTNYINDNGELGVIYADINQGRLPYYHRLDFSINKEYIYENKKITINIGAINLYNRQNIFYFNRITNQKVNQLPFLPSLGISFEF